jgi:hypothetical protein
MGLHRSRGLTPVTWTPCIDWPVGLDQVQILKFKRMEIVAKILNFNYKYFVEQYDLFGLFLKTLKK